MANKKDLATGLIGTALTTSATTLVLQSGYGAGMPSVPFFLTLTPAGQLSTLGNSEIVSVTARTGDSLTIVRAQKSTTARAFAVGDVVANAVYAEDQPQLPAFVSGVSSQSISGAAFTTLSMPTTPLDNSLGGTWNGSIYTIPEDGTYLLIASIRVSDAATVNGYGFGVSTTTGDGPDNYWQGTGATRKAGMYTRLAYLAKGSQMRAFTYVDASGSVEVSNITMQILKVR